VRNDQVYLDFCKCLAILGNACVLLNFGSYAGGSKERDTFKVTKNEKCLSFSFDLTMLKVRLHY
jgi:hypothetical protein